MNASMIHDLLKNAGETRYITHAISQSLFQLVGSAAPAQRAELAMLAAAAERVSDKTLVVLENAADKD